MRDERFDRASRAHLREDERSANEALQQACCNGRCNQGRTCPRRAEPAKPIDHAQSWAAVVAALCIIGALAIVVLRSCSR